MAVRYDLERSARIRNRLIGLLAEGETYEGAAQAIQSPSLRVSTPAVYQFAQRHLAEIDERRRMLQQIAGQEWLGEKTQRIRKLASMYELLDAGLTEYGVWLTETRTSGGSTPETVETQRFNGALIQQMRGILRDAAEELGQIERPSVNTNIQVNQYLVREYGVDNPDQV